MLSKASPKFKSLTQLRDDNDVLERWERDLVLGRKIDVSKLQAMLEVFLEDCQRKLQDKRIGDGSRQEVRTYILHWRLLGEELKKGEAGTLLPVPKKIPTRARTPLPEPSAPKAASGYRSPIDTIREKMGWPALLKPSETRLFSLEKLPCFPPASLRQNADQEG